MVGAKIIRVCKTSGNACHHRSRGSSAIVPLYLRGSKIFSRGFFVSPDFLLVVNTWVRNLFSWVFGYFVGTKFFLLGISLAENFFSWVFRGSESFSREYFVGPFFFSGLISWFKDFQLPATWEGVTETEIQKYISNHVFFSKSISTIVNCFC